MPLDRRLLSCQLQYLEAYRVLLCVTCEYCVLSHALERHLKTIHRMGWAERKLYVESASKFPLASWSEVLYPTPDGPPIPGLPVLDGYACGASGCLHLCVSLKRMQAHWTEKHTDISPFSGTFRRRPVRLQTFFRGGGLRYFRVNDGTNSAQHSKNVLKIKPQPLLVKSPVPIQSSEESTTEWLLNLEFQDRSFISVLPIKGTKLAWRDQMLQISATVDFLRYAILSITASQIAFEYPDLRGLYRHEADRYRGLAIKSISACATRTVEQGGFFEHFNFQRLMTLCYISNVQLAQTDNELDHPVLPEWVQIQRKGRALIWQHRGQGRIGDAMHGPPKQLYDNVHMMPETGVSWNPHDHQLRTLETDLPNLFGAEVDPSCMEALHMLRRVWATPYKEQLVGFRDMALMWTTRIAERYVELLNSHDPVAMIVFAHYCVLWYLAEENYWYMKGHAEKMLRRVVKYLAWEFQDWIAWPVGVMLYRREDQI